MEYVLYASVMLIAMTLAGIIGFAANVLALPVLSMFLDLQTAVAVLLLITFVQIFIQAFQVRKQVDWHDVGKVTFYSVIGMPFGFAALHYLPELWMKGLLGIFVAVMAVRSIWQNRGGHTETFVERPWHKLYLVLSGFFTGAFGCGGPLMVIYMINRYPDKDEYRRVQFTVGAIVMGIPTIANAFAGAYTIEGIPFIIIGFVVVAIALVLSAHLVKRINKEFFQKLVNFALLASAVMLIVQTIQGVVA